MDWNAMECSEWNVMKCSGFNYIMLLIYITELQYVTDMYDIYINFIFYSNNMDINIY